jgi:hypothetical protein
LSRGGHGLRRLVFARQTAQTRPLRPDPPLAKPACRRRPLSGTTPTANATPCPNVLRTLGQGYLVGWLCQPLGVTLGQRPASQDSGARYRVGSRRLRRLHVRDAGFSWTSPASLRKRKRLRRSYWKSTLRVWFCYARTFSWPPLRTKASTGYLIHD